MELVHCNPPWFLSLHFKMAYTQIFAVVVLGFAACSAFVLQTHKINKIGSTSLHAGFGKQILKTDAGVIDTIDETKDCMCRSGSSYKDCCKPFHTQESWPDSIEQMVRSRFSALAYKIEPKYMQITTHPDHKEFVSADRKGKLSKWTKGLKQFAEDYDFMDLAFDELNNELQTEDTGVISFSATIKPTELDKKEEDLKEVSTFKKVDGKWLYYEAEVSNPFKGQTRPEPKSNRMITTKRRAGNSQ